MDLKLCWGWAKTESLGQQISPSKKMNKEATDRVAGTNAEKEQTRRWDMGKKWLQEGWVSGDRAVWNVGSGEAFACWCRRPEKRNADSVFGSGRSPAAGNGSPLQYSHLENPTVRGACRATVMGLQSRTGLSIAPPEHHGPASFPTRPSCLSLSALWLMFWVH